MVYKVKIADKTYKVSAKTYDEALKICKSIYQRQVKDSASSREVLQQLLDDETAAIGAYDIAIKNESEELDDKAIAALQAIRDDEIRHRENLNSIMAGNVTEKNLEDSYKDDGEYGEIKRTLLEIADYTKAVSTGAYTSTATRNIAYKLQNYADKLLDLSKRV